jgi:molybdopterin-guanine dinucleotide biosynthesis protein A
VYYRGMGIDSASDVSAFVLAGGKSTRMGADKAFLEWHGNTLLTRALNLVRSATREVRIVGSPEKFVHFAPVVEDAFPECGPLGGIHAALQASRKEFNLILAVDMPFVSSEFLQYLIGRARSASEAMAVVPRADGRLQPLCAIYRPKFASAAEKALRSGQNRIDLLFNMVPTRVIEEKELEDAAFSSAIFRNLNTPEEVETEKRRA